MQIRRRVLCLVLTSWFLLSLPGPAVAEPLPPNPLAQVGTAVHLQAGDVRAMYDGCGGQIAPVVRADYEQEVVERVNDIRAANGLPPLRRVVELDQAARYHAADMAQDDYFDHHSYDRSGGSLVRACDWSARIQSYYTSWNSLAENIAAGQADPEDVMNSWMNSSGHRANILSNGNWEIGVGYSEGGAYRRYWVQDFGRRYNIYPLIISGEAGTTDTPNVWLYIYGQWEQMRLRNDSDPWGAWQAFRPSFDWSLRSVPGKRTVSAELRKGSQSASSSDSINLNLTVPVLGNLPSALQFAYSIAERRLYPAFVELTPLNVNRGNPASLTWQLATSGPWFSVWPLQGTTPASFRITPGSFDTGSPSTRSGAVIATVTDPAGVSNSPHTFELTLRVVSARMRNLHLPVIARNSTR